LLENEEIKGENERMRI